MTSDSCTVTLEKFTYGGEAMGRLKDGRAVFVSYALPGERVRIRLAVEKRGYARAELLEVLDASPERIQPRCSHFRTCGGCHYQHMPYDAQLRAKEGILRDQLTRIGKIENPPVKPAVPSPQAWNYRNHIQFHLTEDGKLGFVRAGVGLRHYPKIAPAAVPGGEDATSSIFSGQVLSPSPGIVPVTECHLPEAALDALWPQLEFDPGANLARVSLRLGADDDLMLVLASDDPQTPEMTLEAGISVVHLTDGDAVVMAGDDYLVMQVGGRSFHVSAGSFFQVNTAMAGKMVTHLLGNIPLTPRSVLLDVYCGVGLFSAFLAPLAGRVVGVESSPSAGDDFVINLDEFDNVELYQAAARDVLPALDMKPDVILVDPPRAGLDRRVLDAILALKPGMLAYVSCDPSTLARDAARLIKGGYQLKQATPFDLFPQTYHIESVSLFAI